MNKLLLAMLLVLFASASADAQKPKPQITPRSREKPTTGKSDAASDSRKTADDTMLWYLIAQQVKADGKAGETKKSQAWEPLIVLEKHGPELSCGPEVTVPSPEAMLNAQQMEPQLLKLVCANGGTHTFSAVFDRRGIIVLGEDPDKIRYVYRISLGNLNKAQVNGMYVPNSGADELLGTLEPATAIK